MFENVEYSVVCQEEIISRKSMLKLSLSIFLLMICWHDLPNSSMQENAVKIANFSLTYENVNKTDVCNLPVAKSVILTT